MKRKIILFFISLLDKLGLVLKREYKYLEKEHLNLLASESMLAFSLSQMNQVCMDHLVKFKKVQVDLEGMAAIQNLFADEVIKLIEELEIAEKKVEVLTKQLIENRKRDAKRK